MRERLRIAFVGHADHGKSTLIGRLLHDTGSPPEDKVEAIEAMWNQRDMPFELAFVLNAFQAEQDQAVAIDEAHVCFRSGTRDYLIVDVPGHRELVRTMVSGAAFCDAGVLVIDAEEGVRQQTRRGAYLLHLLGVGQLIVAVSKMDRIDFDAERFASVEADIGAYLAALGTEPWQVVPIAAHDGDNVSQPSPRTAWYEGPILLDALDALPSCEASDARDALPFRMPVQGVYHFDERRIIAGRIETGRVSVGDRILFSPSNKTAHVSGIEVWNVRAPLTEAAAGRSIGLTLNEQPVVERGETVSHVERPPIETDVFRARLFWLGHTPLRPGRRCTLRLGTAAVDVEVQSIDRVLDPDAPEGREDGAAPVEVPRDGIAEVILRSRAMLALDAFTANPRTGRFVLADENEIAGGGLISMEGYPDQRALITRRSSNVAIVNHGVSRAARARRNRHAGGVIWLTGFSGAGKSTLAIAAEDHLFHKGYQVYALDGDNVRRGLGATLGFSPEDRAENIRRVGEVAALFADAGFIVLTAFISPYRSDRERARAAAERVSPRGFHEVYVRAPLEVCEARDPQGLYLRARAGEIADFTGVSAPYEPPDRPELTVDTGDRPVEQSLQVLIDHIERYFALVGEAASEE